MECHWLCQCRSSFDFQKALAEPVAPNSPRFVAHEGSNECYLSFKLASAAIASSAAEIQKRTTIFISWCPLKR